MRGTLPPPTTWQVEHVRGSNLPPARFSHAGGGGSTVAHVFSNDAAHLLQAGAATADEDERSTADKLGNKMAAEIVANMEALHQGEHQRDYMMLSICTDVVSHFHPPLYCI